MALQCFRLLLIGRNLKSNLSLVQSIRTSPARAYFLSQPHVVTSWFRAYRTGGARHYCAVSGGDESGSESESSGSESESGSESDSGEESEKGEEDGEHELDTFNPQVHQHAIAPISVPDNFPEVPLLAVSRNPIFPRFVKMLEVS